MLTRHDLTQTFRSLGLKYGDSLIVHSSMRSLGPTDGGAATVLDALLEVVGPNGNLMLPAFNYRLEPENPIFEPESTKALTGAVVEVGRKRSEAVRSLSPTHSVAVIGPDAEELTRDHLSTRAFGVGSPLDRLAQRGGKVLLIGVHQTSNSTIHVAEEHANIPKAGRLDPMPRLKVRLSDGSVTEHQTDTSPSCSSAFEAAALPLRLASAISDVRLGTCHMQLMSGIKVIELIKNLLTENPTALLCSNSACSVCDGTRRNLSR